MLSFCTKNEGNGDSPAVQQHGVHPLFPFSFLVWASKRDSWQHDFAYMSPSGLTQENELSGKGKKKTLGFLWGGAKIEDEAKAKRLVKKEGLADPGVNRKAWQTQW